jgi:hypothetical protein
VNDPRRVMRRATLRHGHRGRSHHGLSPICEPWCAGGRHQAPPVRRRCGCATACRTWAFTTVRRFVGAFREQHVSESCAASGGQPTLLLGRLPETAPSQPASPRQRAASTAGTSGEVRRIRSAPGRAGAGLGRASTGQARRRGPRVPATPDTAPRTAPRSTSEPSP